MKRLTAQIVCLCLCALSSLHPAVGAELFIVGGAANEVLRDFVRLAGDKNAHIVILPHASGEGNKVAEELQNDFHALGAATSQVIPASSGDGLPAGTTGIYMTGGDQNRLVRLLSAKMKQDMARFEGVIAGSSAGAAAMSDPMIAGSMDDTVAQAQRLRIARGLGLLPGVVVDTHVGKRSRDTRLFAVLALMPDAKASLGLDEDTAVHVKGGKCTVYGTGHARYCRRGEGFSSNINSVPAGAVANVKNVTVSLLAAGDEFTLPQ